MKERELNKDTPKTEDFFHENTLQQSTALSDKQKPQSNPALRTLSASMSPPQDVVRHSEPRDVSPITHNYISSSPADRNDANAQESSNLIADLDFIDGPTIAVEVC